MPARRGAGTEVGAMSVRSANSWVEQGQAALLLSRSADSQSELTGDLVQALEAFDAALTLEPTHAEALSLRAQTLERLGRREDAVDAFIAATHAQPDKAPLLLEAAQALFALSHDEAALSVCARAIEREPAWFDARLLLARILSRMRRDEEAIAAWRIVFDDGQARSHPAVISGRLEFALALERLGNGGARAAFDAVFEAHGQGLDGVLTASALRTALQQSRLAREGWSAYLERTVRDGAGWERAGRTWLEASLPNEALDAWQRATSLGPASATAWFGLAEAHAQRRAFDEAIAAYRRALELWPEFLGARARLSVVEAERLRALGGRP